jgi:Fe2+ transport system protein FeoA
MTPKGQQNLTNLLPGESATITAIHGDHDVTMRLLDLGFLEGRVVAMRHRGPFGATVAVEVAGTVVALGPDEAALIDIAKEGVKR